MDIRFIDLFAGIGGFRYGLERCNRRITETSNNEKGYEQPDTNGSNGERWRTNSYTCVWTNEWDKYASSIYKKHFGECDTRDITKVPSTDIPDHDLLVGGFPCQAFSIAGKRKGFDDTRGTLFFEIARILRDKRPRYFLLENVKGLLSHDEGKTFQTILGVLTDLGYEYSWQVLNSKNFGVPQNRERVFIIGNIAGSGRPKVFPIGRTNENYTQQTEKLSMPISNTLRTNYSNGKSNETYIGEGEGVKIRRLTPTECERLQGFPDRWTEEGMEGKISDTQRYKCLGNAVTTNVITAIMERL